MSAIFYIIKQPVFWGGLLLLASLHILGILGLYERVSWYDLMLHGAGGLWVGTLASVWLRYCHPSTLNSLWKSTFFIIALVGVVGVGWEFFEILFDASVGAALGFDPFFGSVRDTMGDLTMDLVGGTIALVIFKIKKERR